jgi:hypothetical protein
LSHVFCSLSKNGVTSSQDTGISGTFTNGAWMHLVAILLEAGVSPGVYNWLLPSPLFPKLDMPTVKHMICPPFITIRCAAYRFRGRNRPGNLQLHRRYAGTWQHNPELRRGG